MLLNPREFVGDHQDEATNAMLREVIAFLEAKGLPQIKKDWHDRVWNQDFVDFMREHQVLATLMTPAGYGAEGSRWDTARNTMFAEIVGFYGITYWYTFQVSMLGLGPVWMGSNEEVKQRAAAALAAGEVFAFGLSEKEHGADIYSSSMELTPQPDGTYLGNGRKYYIGNGNKAAITSMFGKLTDTGDYVFFATDSRHPAYECVKNTVAAQNYVAELALHDYPITDADIMERGRAAWDNMLNTINVCKFNLGFGAVGLATHAFYEALDHAAGRILYGKPVTAFPHVRQLFTQAYVRTIAMRMFADRATDYLRSANGEDRRYLLFNPMVKMKVTMQGEAVMEELHQVIAAKGFEAEPFFEIAKNEMPQLPKLEGTAHVNMALIVKFMQNYLFAPTDFAPVPKRKDAANDDFLFAQGSTSGLGSVRFHDYTPTYAAYAHVPNVAVFTGQVEAFRDLLMTAGPDEQQGKDIDYLLALGDCFTLVVYGHLILENTEHFGADDALLDQMFDVFVRDMNHYAMNVFGKTSNSAAQREKALALVAAPVADDARFEEIWNRVNALVGTYQQ